MISIKPTSRLTRIALIVLGVIILSIITLLDVREMSESIGTISNANAPKISSLIDFALSQQLIINN